jgi:hypothetical protein
MKKPDYTWDIKCELCGEEFSGAPDAPFQLNYHLGSRHGHNDDKAVKTKQEPKR